MEIKEFEQRTGHFPSQEEYKVIEEYYMTFAGDKDVFCKAYKKNVDWIAEKIQHEVDLRNFKDRREAEKHLESYKTQITKLEKALEREQEWEPYTTTQNVAQGDYEKLANGVGEFSYYMSDSEAIAWISNNFDFDPNKIVIIHEIDEYEVNRHRQLRKTGRKIDRRPIYCATDYYYIRFNTRSNYYEVWSDELQPFFD